MKSGDLDQRIELFAPGAPVDDGYTTAPGAPVSRGKRWAKYMGRSVREVFENAGNEAEARAVFLVRRDSVTVQVDATWKLVHNGATYDVKGKTWRDRDGVLIEGVAGD